MTALRKETLQMVNDMPDDLLAALVQNLKNFKYVNRIMNALIGLYYCQQFKVNLKTLQIT